MNITTYLRDRQYGVKGLGRKPKQELADRFVENRLAESHINKPCSVSGHCRSTFIMDFSPDGTKVASTHGDHTVRVSDLRTGKCLHTLRGHPRTPWCLAYHPSSNHIVASGCLGGQVRIWDLYGSGCEVWQMENNKVIAALTFHPTDHVLVMAAGNTLYFWDWSKPEPFAKCNTTDEYERIRWVKFDSLGHHLYTGICNNITIHREEIPDVTEDSRRHRRHGDTNIPAESVQPPGSTFSMYNNLVSYYQQHRRDQLMTQRTQPPGPSVSASTPRMASSQNPGPRSTDCAGCQTMPRSDRGTPVSNQPRMVFLTTGNRRRQGRDTSSHETRNQLVQESVSEGNVCSNTNGTDMVAPSALLNPSSDPFLASPEPIGVEEGLYSCDSQEYQVPSRLSSSSSGIPTATATVSDAGCSSWEHSVGVHVTTLATSLQGHAHSSRNITSRRLSGDTLVSVYNEQLDYQSNEPIDTVVPMGSRLEQKLGSDISHYRQSLGCQEAGHQSQSATAHPVADSNAEAENNSDPDFQALVRSAHASTAGRNNFLQSCSANVATSTAVEDTSTSGNDILSGGDLTRTKTDREKSIDLGVYLNRAAAKRRNEHTTVRTNCKIPKQTDSNSSGLDPSFPLRGSACRLSVSPTVSANSVGSNNLLGQGSGPKTATNTSLYSSFQQSKPFSSIRDRLQSTVPLCTMTSSTQSSKVATSLQSGRAPSVTVISAPSNIQTSYSAGVNISNSCRPQNTRLNLPARPITQETNSIWNSSSTDVLHITGRNASDSRRFNESAEASGNSCPSNMCSSVCNQSNLTNVESVPQASTCSTTDSRNHSRLSMHDEDTSRARIVNNIGIETRHNSRRHLFEHVFRNCSDAFSEVGVTPIDRANSRPAHRNISSTNFSESSDTFQDNSRSSTHSRIQASSDTENELSSHLNQSAAYFMPISECPSRTYSSASSTHSLSGRESSSETLSQGTSSTESSAGQSSSTQTRDNNLELTVDQNDNYTSHSIRDPMQILREIRIRNNDGNNNSIHILQPVAQSSASAALSSTASVVTSESRPQGTINRLSRSAQDMVDQHQHYVTLRNNFVSMTDQIEREMSALNRRIHALRDSFNESLVALHQDRQRYQHFGTSSLSNLNGVLSAGSGLMADDWTPLSHAPVSLGRADMLSSGDESTDSDGSPGPVDAASALTFSQPPTLLETSLRSHSRSRQLEPVLYDGSGLVEDVPEIPLRPSIRQQRPNSSNWRLLHRHFLHPHYSNNILDEAINRPNNAIQSAINRAISGAFVGTAVANNMINQTHRIQAWDFSKCQLPDLTERDKNVIVLHCKLHNSASCDIACTDTLLATFVPSPQGFPEDNILAVYSLLPTTRGQCLYTKSFGPNAISISISPSNKYVLIGLAAKRLAWVFTSKQLVAQIYKLDRAFEGEKSMKHVRDVKHTCNQEERTHVSGNSARWLPQSGHGLVYGTNRGDLHLCLPGPKIEHNIHPALRGRSLGSRYQTATRLPRWMEYSTRYRVSASTQTHGHTRGIRQSAGTQTDQEDRDSSQVW